MAWNEPGGNSNNQDPWGGRNNNGGGNGGRKGPPDLDEALRKFQDRINRLVGGKKRSGGSGGDSFGSGGGKGLLLLGVLLVGALWLYNAVYVVDEQEQAVVLRLGKYHETVGPGLNIYFPPFETKYQENVTRERAYSKQGAMLTQDENIVEVPLTVQYRITNLKDFVLNVDQPEVSLQQATDSAVRHVAGSSTMDQLLTDGREQVATSVRERLQRFLDTYGTGITVTQVNIQSASAPREVQEAFDDVIRAREDEQREKNQAEAYANGVIPEARGAAQRIIEEANGYRDEVVARAQGDASRFSQLAVQYAANPQLTRERLYIETMQEVLGQASKVMVTGQAGQNLLYLPLDKLMQNRAPAPASAISSGAAPAASSDTAASVIRNLPQSTEARTRESR